MTEPTLPIPVRETIAPHRRLNTKFIAMALLFSLAPQVFLYFFASNTASDMLIESLRDDLKEKSFLVGADIGRFFHQRELDVRLLSQADVLESDDVAAIIQYLTEISEGTGSVRGKRTGQHNSIIGNSQAAS